MHNSGQHKEFQGDKYQQYSLQLPKIRGRPVVKLCYVPFQYNIQEAVEFSATLDPHSLPSCSLFCEYRTDTSVLLNGPESNWSAGAESQPWSRGSGVMPSHRNRVHEALSWLSTYPQGPDTYVISAPHCLKAAVLPLTLRAFICNTTACT